MIIKRKLRYISVLFLKGQNQKKCILLTKEKSWLNNNTSKQIEHSRNLIVFTLPILWKRYKKKKKKERYTFAYRRNIVCINTTLICTLSIRDRPIILDSYWDIHSLSRQRFIHQSINPSNHRSIKASPHVSTDPNRSLKEAH